MVSSPVVQASQESIEFLHAAASHWGQVFAAQATARSPLESQAETVAAIFEAFGVAYSALPRFRTEPALRRFMEAMQRLERSLRDAKVPPFGAASTQAAEAAGQGARRAEAAFAALSGKPVESPEVARPVRGSVQRLLSDRGYGFVRADGATSEIFFTAQSVRGARFGDLRVGQTVSFRIVPDPRVPGRMHAIDVHALR